MDLCMALRLSVFGSGLTKAGNRGVLKFGPERWRLDVEYWRPN